MDLVLNSDVPLAFSLASFTSENHLHLIFLLKLEMSVRSAGENRNPFSNTFILGGERAR